MYGEDDSIMKMLLKVLLKVLCVGIIFLTIYSMANVGIENIIESSEEKDMSSYVNACDRYYYEKQYGQLRDYLFLYELYDDTFDVYWEVVNGYCDYIECVQWASAAETGLDGSISIAEQYLQKVAENAENCRFPANEERLCEYVNMLKE